MTTLELFASTIILCLVAGGLIGAAIVNVLWVEPLERKVHADRLRLIRTQVDAATKREHRGTPYLRTPNVWQPLPLEIAEALLDNDRWSVKAPEEIATVTPLRVQTGRPV